MAHEQERRAGVKTRSVPMAFRLHSASPEFRAACRAQFAAMNKASWAGPKCGARRKRDGEPCEQRALPNGRCRFHGGRVPKGKDWHRLQPPAPGSKREAAVARKVKLVEARRAKAAKARAEKVAAMTPAERELFERRSAAMRNRLPGPKSGRERQKQARKNAAWLQELIAAAENRPAPAAERPPLKKRRGRPPKAAKAAPRPPQAPAGSIDWRTYREGVFA